MRPKFINRCLNILLTGPGRTTIIQNLACANGPQNEGVPARGKGLCVESVTVEPSPFQKLKEGPATPCTRVLLTDEATKIHYKLLVQDTPDTDEEDAVAQVAASDMKDGMEEDPKFDQGPDRQPPMTESTVSHVDVCLYIVADLLQPADITAIDELSRMMPIVPLIAKGDSMTKHELLDFKRHVSQALDISSPEPCTDSFRPDETKDAGVDSVTQIFSVLSSCIVDAIGPQEDLEMIRARHLAGLNEEVICLSARAQGALEKYKSAKAETAQASHALSLSSEDKRLQRKLRQAAGREQMHKKMYDMAQELLEDVLRNREAMEALVDGQGLTLQETVDYPVLPLPQCSTAESSSLYLTFSATHGQVLPWEDFGSGSSAMFVQLDSSRRAYSKPDSSILHGRQVQREVDRSEIRDLLSHYLEPVNMAAAAIGIAVECCRGGDGRGISHSDMILRRAGAHSDPEGLSREILGTVLVTDSLQLKRGERLEAALKDPKRKDTIEALLQQAYADAVMDEAPVFTLTDYNVTVFFKRSMDSNDTRVWASEPVWVNQLDTPARAAWLNCMHEADQLRSYKADLPRCDVPPTEHQALWRKTGTDTESSDPSGASTHTNFSLKRQRGNGQQQASTREGFSKPNAATADTTACRSPKRQRTSAQHADERSAEAPAVSPGIAPCSSRGVEQGQGSLPAQPASLSIPASRVEDVLLLSDLGLTDELITASSYGYTLKGLWRGVPAAVKVFNQRQRGAVEAFDLEKHNYNTKLKDLQGTAVPRFLGSGLLVHNAAPAIVLSYEGKPKAKDGFMTKGERKSMQSALSALHNRGGAHGDVHLSKFLVKDGVAKLVDFDQTVFPGPKQSVAAEKNALRALLAGKGACSKRKRR